MEDILALLIPAFGSILSALASWGMFEGTRYLRSKTKSDTAKHALDILSTTTGSVVHELEKTVVAEYKKDGKLTPENIAHIKDAALSKIKNQLPIVIQKTAGQAVLSLDDFIKGQIEKSVKEMKA